MIIRNDENNEGFCRLKKIIQKTIILGQTECRRVIMCVSVWVAMWVMRVGFSYQLGKVTRHCCAISESLRPRMRTKHRVASMMASDANVS